MVHVNTASTLHGFTRVAFWFWYSWYTRRLSFRYEWTDNRHSSPLYAECLAGQEHLSAGPVAYPESPFGGGLSYAFCILTGGMWCELPTSTAAPFDRRFLGKGGEGGNLPTRTFKCFSLGQPVATARHLNSQCAIKGRSLKITCIAETPKTKNDLKTRTISTP